MGNTEQMLVDVGNVQLINLDQLHTKTRQKIFDAEKFDHDFSTLHVTDVVEDKPAVFYSDKDKKFIEVFIDQVQRLDMGGMVFWHKVDIKIAS